MSLRSQSDDRTDAFFCAPVRDRLGGVGQFLLHKKLVSYRFQMEGDTLEETI